MTEAEANELEQLREKLERIKDFALHLRQGKHHFDGVPRADLIMESLDELVRD